MSEQETLERLIEVQNSQGIHARPAAMIVKLASQYQATLTVAREDEDDEINAKSIMGIMMLAAEPGSSLLFRAQGPDAAELLDALEELFRSKFNE